MSKFLCLTLNLLVMNFVSAECLSERILLSESPYSSNTAVVFKKVCAVKVEPYLYVAIVKGERGQSNSANTIAILDSLKNSLILSWDKLNGSETLTIQKDKLQNFSKKLNSYDGIDIKYVQ
ncbi:hypothetical protein [Aliikangiella sp. IMCC44632]